MRTMTALIGREFARFWQHKVFAAVFLLMPVAISTVLGFVYYQGKLERLPVLVVDEDHSPTSDRLMDMLTENDALHVISTRRSAVHLEQLVLDERAAAVMVIPFRFEADLMTKRVPEINCYLNMGNSLSAGTVGSAVQMTVATFNAGAQIAVSEKKGIPPKIAQRQYEAFHNNVFMRYNPAGNYLYFLWPGMIFSLLHQLLLLAGAAGFSQEYADNTFTSQLLKYSRSPAVLVIAKIFPYPLLSLFTVGFYYCMSQVFRIPVPAFPATMLISVLLLAISTCLLATVFSVSSLPVKASQVVMTIGSPAFSLTGLAWSPAEIPPVLRAIADAVPLTPFLRSLRLIWIQNATMEQVMPLIYHQLILVAVYFVLSYLLLRKKIRGASSSILLPVNA